MDNNSKNEFKASKSNLTANQLALKDAVASLKIVTPILMCLTVILIIFWATNLSGDRDSRFPMLYLRGYIFMLAVNAIVLYIVNRFGDNVSKHETIIQETQISYAWFLPLWSTIISFLDAFLGSETFGSILFMVTDLLIMAVCIMKVKKWLIIQLVCGIIMLLSYFISSIPGSQFFLIEMTAYIIASYVAGKVIFTSRWAGYRRLAELQDIASTQSRYALLDDLTGLLNRRAYVKDRREMFKSGNFTVLIADVNSLKLVNDRYGHQAGDEMLQGTASVLKNTFGSYGTIYRVGGDEFGVLMSLTSEELNDAIARLDMLCYEWNREHDLILTMAKGWASKQNHPEMGLEELIKLADQHMYDDKSRFYLKEENNRRKNRSDQEKMIQKLSATLQDVEYDDLTGVYTKQAFYYYVHQILIANPEKQYDLLIADIEDFKQINANYSEKAGDRVLAAIGAYLKRAEQKQVLVGRYGGDQFAAFLEHREDNIRFTTDMFSRMSKQIPVKNIVFKFGIYECVNHTEQVSVLCDCTLMALRTVKHQYGKYFATYDEKLRQKLLLQQKIENSMRDALEQKQFMVYYQPKHDIQTGKIIGAEALIRWQHPEFGFMSPGDFIPVFEQNGFVTETDYYVWEQTCINLRKWINSGMRVVPVSVNASKLDFQMDEYWERLNTPVNEYKVPVKYLHIEVTESLFSEHMEVLIDTLQKCREAGFKIELDDFGTGYSSLNTLGVLPLDVLKLDMSFMRQIHDERKLRVLAAAISLAKSLNLQTVVEGVENEEQLDIIRNLGGDFVQGYYYSRPLPADQFEKYLMENI